MSEQEPHIRPEDLSQSTEESIDVTTLKKIDMSVDDYNQYADMYPDDPRVADLLEQYGILPGEPIIVSATDMEHPENNLMLVVATGEDSFTTNRSLTTELQDRLRDTDDSVERAIPIDEVKEIGSHALSAAGVTEPAANREQEVVSEQILLDAKSTFDERLNKLAGEYSETSNRYKHEIKTNAEKLSAMNKRLEESSQSALDYLRSGISQPERVRHVADLAIEELSTANRILGVMLEAAEEGSVTSGSLRGHIEAHKGDVGGLHGELRANLGQIVADAPEMDRAALGRADAEAGEAAARHVADANQLNDAVKEISAALRRIDDDVDMVRQRTRSLLGRLDDIKVSLSQGRLNSSDYEDVVRSAIVLVNEPQESKAIRRLAVLAEGL